MAVSSPMSTGSRGRLTRFTLVAVSCVLGALVALELQFLLGIAIGHSGTVGLDLSMYRDRARSFVSGGGFYLPRQLAGPYVVQAGDALYPPVVLVLLVPMLALPDPVWWIVPVALTLYAMFHHRPALWALPVILGLVLWPKTPATYLYGNPAMWGIAAIAAGTVWGWPFVGAAIKPVLAPLALIGARHRSWWIALGVGALIATIFAPMWADYVRVVLDARSDDPFYLLGDLPTAAIPLVAWAARRRMSQNESMSGRETVVTQ